MDYKTRTDFVDNWFDYEPGEHLNVIGPTGTGKTHLIGQLLPKVLSEHPELDTTFLVPKPDDPPMHDLAKKLSFRITDQWPPKKKFWEASPEGYMLWPHHIIDDEEANQANLTHTFRQAFNGLYGTRGNILVADDAYLLGVTYKLNRELDRHWIAGRSGGSGLWTSLQKPSGTLQGAVSSFAYDAPTHMFFGRDNDERNLKRISEIGASTVDPDYIRDVIRNLKIHRINGSSVSELLYLDRRGPFMAIVGV